MKAIQWWLVVSLLVSILLMPSVAVVFGFFADRILPGGEFSRRIQAGTGPPSFHLLLSERDSSITPATVRLLIRDVDTKDLRLRLSIEIIFPSATLETIVDSKTFQKVFADSGWTTGMRPRPEYEMSGIKFVLWDVMDMNDAGSATEFLVPFRLLRKANDGTYRWTAANHEISLVGQPQQFPSDWYWHRASLGVEVPSPFMALAKRSAVFILPIRIEMAIDRNLQGLQISTAPPRRGKSLESFDFIIERSTIITWFSYSIVVLFFFLSALIAYTAFRLEGSNESLWQVLTALAAVALAVLPLRTVLVPNDISGVTRLDALLALIIAVLLFVGSLRMILALRSTFSRRRRRTNGG